MNSASQLQTVATKILTHLRLSKAEPLPAGGEGLLFSCDDKVLKVYKDHATRDLLEQVAAFQNKLRDYDFSFATPLIEEIGEHEGTFYTIEKKLPGEQLDRVIASLSTKKRQQAYQSYYETIRQINQIELEDLPCGQILHMPDAITASSWPEFLVAKLRQRLLHATTEVKSQVHDFERKAAYLEQLIDKEVRSSNKRLVHADYYLNNVLVNSDLQISAILDFSLHMAVGDPRYDVMSVLRWNMLNQSIQEDDYAFLYDWAKQDYGSDLDTYLNLYFFTPAFTLPTWTIRLFPLTD